MARPLGAKDRTPGSLARAIAGHENGLKGGRRAGRLSSTRMLNLSDMAVGEERIIPWRCGPDGEPLGPNFQRGLNRAVDREGKRLGMTFYHVRGTPRGLVVYRKQ